LELEGRNSMHKQHKQNEEQSIAALTRRSVLKLGAAAAAMPLFSRAPQDTAASLPTKQAAQNLTEWPQYGGDKASTKYSPLDQITPENFSKLKVA
jgi:glucose dehydrogenase